MKILVRPRVVQEDFGGRAVGGYRAARGEYWVKDGIITEKDKWCPSHGTHCASTAGGTAYGVAAGATLVSVQVLSCAGSGYATHSN